MHHTIKQIVHSHFAKDLSIEEELYLEEFSVSSLIVCASASQMNPLL